MTLDIHAGSWRFLRPERAEAYIDVYARQHHATSRKLVPVTTRRQFRTAAEILDRMKSGKRGILLADDVGLGKTTIAALVALVFAGKGKRVRILAPNAIMARRWRQELEDHTESVRAFAPHLALKSSSGTTYGHVQRLNAGCISVTTHGKAAQLSCDLLIVDEAHRARSEKSNLAAAIKRAHRSIDRMLVLTATPFSIDPKDLARLLSRIGGADAARPTKKFASVLRDLWRGRSAGTPEVLADQLVTAATAAVTAIQQYVIRHGVSDLSADERKHFGVLDDAWGRTSHEPPAALLEAMLRTDRALGLGRKTGAWSKTRTNDPRHHVGAHQLQKDLDEILEFDGMPDPSHEHALAHARAAKKLLTSNGRHAKVEATVGQVGAIVAENEKVLIFCDHHATAAELAHALADDLRWPRASDGPTAQAWRTAWETILEEQRAEAEEGTKHDRRVLQGYLAWLCSPGVKAQIESWISPGARIGGGELARLLEREPARALPVCDSIAQHARELYVQLSDPESRSTRAILSNPGSRGLPGRDLARVAAVCEPLDADADVPGILFPKQPDAVLAVFNSPFGPDVLVATDRLSEGIDLHYFCRHLIHHELDPSPVRTVQRNGRIRRVNCWAHRSGQPIRIAYPALSGTRDEKLVEIMRHRLLQFDLLLGGVRGKIDPDAQTAAPSTTEEILACAKSRLQHLRLCLDADEHGAPVEGDEG